MDGTLKFLAGVMIGALAGAVAGILFAPDSGSKTRKRISKEVGKLKDELVETTEKRFAEIKKDFDKIAGEYTSAAKEKISKITKSSSLN